MGVFQCLQHPGNGWIVETFLCSFKELEASAIQIIQIQHGFMATSLYWYLIQSDNDGNMVR